MELCLDDVRENKSPDMFKKNSFAQLTIFFLLTSEVRRIRGQICMTTRKENKCTCKYIFKLSNFYSAFGNAEC